MAPIQWFIFLTILGMILTNSSLENSHFLDNEESSNEIKDLSFNGLSPKKETKSRNMQGNQNDNCTQYITDLSCLHFYGCVWMNNTCTFYQYTPGFQSSTLNSTLLASNFTLISFLINSSFINENGKRLENYGYNFFINYLTEEFHWSYSSYYTMTPLSSLCGVENFNFFKTVYSINNYTFDRSLPTYTHCSWIINKYEYDNSVRDFPYIPLEFSLKRQGNGYDKVKICNVRIRRSSCISYCSDYYYSEYFCCQDLIFQNSSLDCSLDNSSYIKNGIVSNVSNEEEYLVFKTIDYEYIGPPFQNYFSFAFQVIDTSHSKTIDNLNDINNKLNSLINNNSKAQNVLLTDVQNDTSQMKDLLKQLVNLSGGKVEINNKVGDEAPENSKYFYIFIYIICGYAGLLTLAIIIVYCVLRNRNRQNNGVSTIQIENASDKSKPTYREFKIECNERGIKGSQQTLNVCSLCNLPMNEGNEELLSLPCSHNCHFKCMKAIFKLKGAKIKCILCKSKFLSKDIMIPGNIVNLNEEKKTDKSNLNLYNLKSNAYEINSDKAKMNMGKIEPTDEKLEYPSLEGDE